MKCLWNQMGLLPPSGTERNEMGRTFCEGKMGFGLRIPALHGHQCQKVSYCCLAQLLQTCFCSVQSHCPHQNSPWLPVSVCGTPAGIPRKEITIRTLDIVSGSVAIGRYGLLLTISKPGKQSRYQHWQLLTGMMEI